LLEPGDLQEPEKKQEEYKMEKLMKIESKY